MMPPAGRLAQDGEQLALFDVDGLKGAGRAVHPGHGNPTAPECAQPLVSGTRGAERLPEPVGGLSLDVVAVWGVVQTNPGATQREILKHLVRVWGRQRILQAIEEGIGQGWLDRRSDKQGRRHRHYVAGQVISWQVGVDAALAVLEQAVAGGQLLDHREVLRLLKILHRVGAAETSVGGVCA